MRGPVRYTLATAAALAVLSAAAPAQAGILVDRVTNAAT